jgi:hypothetical protein
MPARLPLPIPVQPVRLVAMPSHARWSHAILSGAFPRPRAWKRHITPADDNTRDTIGLLWEHRLRYRPALYSTRIVLSSLLLPRRCRFEGVSRTKGVARVEQGIAERKCRGANAA